MVFHPAPQVEGGGFLMKGFFSGYTEKQNEGFSISEFQFWSAEWNVKVFTEWV